MVQPPLLRDWISYSTNMFWPEQNRARHRIFAVVKLHIQQLEIETNPTTCSRICVPLLAHKSTKEQTKQHDDVQCRGLQVIFGNIQYDKVRCIYNIPSLAECWIKLCRAFLPRIIRDKSNILRNLLPARHDTQLMAWLHCARQYPTIYAQTNCYKNCVIVYGLNCWQ